MKATSRFRRLVRNRAGSALAVTLVSMGAVVGMVAISVEGGMLYSTHAETSRAADAAALAGVTAFDEATGTSETDLAYERALEYAQMNPVRNTMIDEADLEIVPLPDSGYVRVTVTATVPTMFARIFGLNNVTVRSTAKAAVQNSGTAQCLTPLVMPDAFNDVNSNGIFEAAAGDYYETGVTSYGTAYRDGDGLYSSDFGRPIMMVRGNPVGNSTAGGFFTLDNGTSLSDPCAIPTVQTGSSMSADVDPGFSYGTVFNPINDIIEADPGLTWNGSAFTGSVYPDWRGSQRIAAVALYDPRYPPSSSPDGTVTIVGFAGIFWDYVQSSGSNKHIGARFVSVRGVPDNCALNTPPTCSSFNSVVRLIQ